MRKLIMGLVMGLVITEAMSRPQAQVFVSFSMPAQLLQQTLSESARLNIPAILNGLIDNSMPATVQRIQTLSKTVPNLNIQIDPTAFERFEIKQVPALVVDNGNAFDVLYGNLSLREGLMRIAERGESGLTVGDVRRLIGD